MRIFLTVIFCFLCESSFSQNIFTFPKEPFSTLAKSYPESKCLPEIANKLAHLRLCRKELESFREHELEIYHDEIKEFNLQIQKLDVAVNKANTEGKLRLSEYKKTAKKLEIAIFNATQKKGKFMKEYYTHYNNYKKTIDWVKAEIIKSERLQLQFGSK